jgi:hypothetical protein
MVLHRDPELGAYRVKGSALQIAPEVADDSKRGTEVQCLVTALAARRVEGGRDTPGASQRFHLANGLIAGHTSLSDESVRMYCANRVSFAAAQSDRHFVRSWPGRAIARARLVAGNLPFAGTPRQDFRARREGPLMAEGGCSCRRNRRHFADVQDQDLTGRFGASNPASRPSQVGHDRSVATCAQSWPRRAAERQVYGDESGPVFGLNRPRPVGRHARPVVASASS